MRPNVYFKDENGVEYISSPEYNYGLDICILLGLGAGMPFLLGLAFWVTL